MNKAEKELYGILSPELRWNKARLTCFIRMLMAIFAVKTINLTSIAAAFNNDAKIPSRFIKECNGSLHYFILILLSSHDLFSNGLYSQPRETLFNS